MLISRSEFLNSISLLYLDSSLPTLLWKVGLEPFTCRRTSASVAQKARSVAKPYPSLADSPLDNPRPKKRTKKRGTILLTIILVEIIDIRQQNNVLATHRAKPFLAML